MMSKKNKKKDHVNSLRAELGLTNNASTSQPTSGLPPGPPQQSAPVIIKKDIPTPEEGGPTPPTAYGAKKATSEPAKSQASEKKPEQKTSKGKDDFRDELKRAVKRVEGDESIIGQVSRVSSAQPAGYEKKEGAAAVAQPAGISAPQTIEEKMVYLIGQRRYRKASLIDALTDNITDALMDLYKPEKSKALEQMINDKRQIILLQYYAIAKGLKLDTSEDIEQFLKTPEVRKDLEQLDAILGKELVEQAVRNYKRIGFFEGKTKDEVLDCLYDHNKELETYKSEDLGITKLIAYFKEDSIYSMITNKTTNKEAKENLLESIAELGVTELKKDGIEFYHSKLSGEYEELLRDNGLDFMIKHVNNVLKKINEE